MKKFIYFISILSIVSCSKDPGFGGNSAIVGTLMEQTYTSDFSLLLNDTIKNNTYVYLSIKNGYGYLSRVRTNFDGTFSFTNLTSGNYQVYAYSKDTTQASAQDISIVQDASITGGKSLVDIGNITIAGVVTTGTASIKGKILRQSQSNATLQYPADNHRVYLVYNNEISYRSLKSTNYNGEFEFLGLPRGKYKIYTYSQDVANVSLSSQVPVFRPLQITKDGQLVTTTDIVIN